MADKKPCCIRSLQRAGLFNAPVSSTRRSLQRSSVALLAFSAITLVNNAPLWAQTPLSTAASNTAADFSMKGIKMSAKAYGLVNLSRLRDVDPHAMAAEGPHTTPRPSGDTLDALLGTPSISSETPLEPEASESSPSSSLLNAFAVANGLNSFASPSPLANFQAAADNMTFIPPDTDGAAGPNHLVTALNGTVQVQDRNGNQLQIKSLNDFWGIAATSTDYAYDPTVLYDPYNDRWIMTSCARPDSHVGYILLAVSQTGDPTGNWYRWTTYPNAYKPGFLFPNGYPAEWADYDRTGFNKNWIVTQTNMYYHGATEVFEGTFVSVFPKSALYTNTSGQGSYLNYTLFARSDIGQTQVPAATYDNGVNPLYLLQDPRNGSQLKMFKVDGSIGSETFSSVATVSSRLGSWGVDNPGALQAGSSTSIDLGDAHINNLVYRNSSLWAAQTVNVNSRGVVQWWQLSTGGSVQQQGRINPSDSHERGYPSIAVNARNAALIGYSIFSPNTYPSAAYSYRSSSDTGGTLESEVVYKSGLGPYNHIANDPSGRNRWGDYSTTVVDPVNDLSFWTIQEYAETPNVFDPNNPGIWGTWWAHI